MADSWNKKEREKKKLKEKQDKAEKKKERKENQGKSGGLDAMMAYVDEDGNITDTPPDPSKRKEIKLEDIEIGVPKYVPLTEEERTRKGRISFFNFEKGFGFIRDLQTQESIFVHSSNLPAQFRENDQVSFETEMGPRGPYAVNVKVIS